LLFRRQTADEKSGDLRQNVPICRETEPATFCIGSRSSGAPTACTAAIRKGETINARALTEMFKTIIANNRVGGWRKLTETD
jgi:hypothetical protein